MATDIIARGIATKALEHGGGGEGGTTNYNALTNKPSINGATLSGNKTAAELGLADSGMFAAASSHNGIFRGKNLTGIYTVDQLHEKVSAGDFSDLYLGDYITVSITTTLPDEDEPVTETVDLMIAAFDYYYNAGNPAITEHHLVLVPRKSLTTIAPMNQSDTTEGGYLGSYMHQNVLPRYAESLKAALKNHVLTHHNYLTNKITASAASAAGAGLVGSASGWEWTEVTLQLMNEVQVYGTTVFSSSAYDVGVDNRQFPVFRFIGPHQYGRSAFWLRSVVSSTLFASCGNSGAASCPSASAKYGVRPLMLFG